jgi:hypothetical protein
LGLLIIFYSLELSVDSIAGGFAPCTAAEVLSRLSAPADAIGYQLGQWRESVKIDLLHEFKLVIRQCKTVLMACGAKIMPDPLAKGVIGDETADELFNRSLAHVSLLLELD